jgi:hypothetical protein
MESNPRMGSGQGESHGFSAMTPIYIDDYKVDIYLSDPFNQIQPLLKFLEAEWLGQQGDERMGLGKFQGDLVRPSGGKQDRHLRKEGAKARQGAASPQSWHVHIENHHIGRESSFNRRQRIFTG